MRSRHTGRDAGRGQSGRGTPGRGLGLALLAALVLGLAPAAQARIHHVAAADAPASGGSPDGSAEHPWPSVAAALDSTAVAGGDTLSLAPGPHGRLVLRNLDFDPALTIAAAPGGQVQVDQIDIRRSSGLTLDGFAVWPLPGGPKPDGPLVSTDRASREIRLRKLDIRTTPDADGYRDWDLATWQAQRRLGVRLLSSDSELADSTVTGVSGGVNVVGAGNRVTGNEIRGFSKDAMRVFGRGSVISGNTIRDCVKIDKNHDDAVQSWVGKKNPDGAVIGIVLDSNRILEWTGAPDHPLRCALQGIGLFDGPFRDWVIQNNLIVVRAHHGIALYDMHNARVLNNTVINPNAGIEKSPWILQKGASLTGGNIIANNLVTALRLGKGEPGASNNLKVRYPERIFEDPAGLDYRLRSGSPGIGAADPALTPGHDIEGTPRPQGAAPDLGAFERP